jgi:CheY-like chemotaxis protein
VQSNIDALNELLGGLRNAATFMNMAINRCLDFTKSSKGIALTANPETVDLRTVLKLPLRVISDMQTRIGITQEPLPPEVCTHIVTDIQWLQENILCLLSNAVKYAVTGTVVIRTTLHDVTELQYEGTELDAGVFTSARLASIANISPSGKENHYAALGGAQSMDSCDLKSEELYINQNEKTVRIAFNGVSIRRIQGGVIFISRQLLRASQKVDTLRSKGRFLQFEVIDGGIGLAEDAMLTIFHPFRQTHRMNGGVGLGLFSLAKRLEALGGYYGVSKRADGQQGCRFFFGIPYLPDELAASLRTKPAPTRMLTFVRKDKVVAGESFSTDEGSPSRHVSLDLSAKKLRTLHVLVVDDSLAILKMTSMVLRKQGHEVETAQHGAEAIDKLELARFKGVNPFDVMIIDLQMPVMDGLEAIRRIRSGEREHRETRKSSSMEPIESVPGSTKETPQGSRRAMLEQWHQPIVAMSANGDSGARSASLSAGADKFIAKPFTMETLSTVLMELLVAPDATS